MKAIALGMLASAMPLHAATVATAAGDEQSKLAMQLNNPVAALISVPLQPRASSFRHGIGHFHDLRPRPALPRRLGIES